MKVLLLGTGGVGSVIARHLATSKHIDGVTATDIDENRAKALASEVGSKRVRSMRLDASDQAAIEKAIEGHDLVINATLPRFNLEIMAVALDNGVNYLDLAGGGEDQLKLHSKWKSAGYTAVLGMGEDPGIANVFAKYAVESMDEADTVKIRDGETSTSEEFPFVCLFSPEVFIEETLTDAVVFENGEWRHVPGMTGHEDYRFPEPVGTVPVYFVQHEEVETIPKFIGKKLRYCDFKLALLPDTVRILKFIGELGLLKEEIVTYKGNRISPREVLFSLIPPPGELTGKIHGYATLLVENTGWQDGAHKNHKIWMTMSHDDAARKHNTNATSYLTGTGAAVGAILMAQGKIKEAGVFTPEALDPKPFFPELQSKDIEIHEKVAFEREVPV